MARHDLLIKGGTIVNSWGRQQADVLVDGERIAGIVAPGMVGSARRVIDADGRYLIPGLVDTHSHHRDPGFTHKEDVTSATRAAAVGGVTTTFAMPNVSPPPKDTATLEAMIDHYRTSAVVDWNINAAATDRDQIAPLAAMGIAGFKIYMVADTGRDYPHMPGLGVHDHGRLFEIFEVVKRTGLPLMIHVHDQSIMDVIEQGYWDRDERDFRAYARAYADYDGIVWEAALAVVLRMQQSIGTRLHVLHTQTKGMVDQIRTAKGRGALRDRRDQSLDAVSGRRMGNRGTARLLRALLLGSGTSHRSSMEGHAGRDHRPDRYRPRSSPSRGEGTGLGGRLGGPHRYAISGVLWTTPARCGPLRSSHPRGSGAPGLCQTGRDIPSGDQGPYRGGARRRPSAGGHRPKVGDHR